MSQLGSQDVQLHAASVTQYIGAIQNREESVVQNFKACKDAVLEAADLYVSEKDGTKLAKLREQLLELVEVEQRVQAHKAALAQVGREYQPSLDMTDFEVVLEKHLQATGPSAHPERDEDVQEFDKLVGSSTAMAEELGEGEDLAITGNAERNEKCPYTLKALIDLNEPVEDHMGFVYEAAAIKDAIAREGYTGDRHGWIETPIVGANHTIRLRQLKPCKRVIRMQKQRQRQRGVGTNTQGGATQRGARVLDI